MKRMKTITVVLLAALLCFAATALAGEFSFYDSVNNWIVRAYTEPNQTVPGTYNIYMQMVDPSSGQDLNASEIKVNGVTLTQGTYPVFVCDCAVSPDVSLSYKTGNGVTEVYAFHTDQGAFEMETFTLARVSQQPPPTPANISVNPGSIPFGNVNVGSSSTSYVTVNNTGQADLTLTSINVTGPSFSRNGGTCGTTVQGGGNCTIGVKFEPAGASPYTGNLAIQSNDGDTQTVNVGLTGTGVQQSGAPDLTITGSFGLGSTYEVGTTYHANVTVRNQGTALSGPFTVKGYQGSNMLFTWSVGSLDAAGSASNTINWSPSGACAVHTQCHFSIKVDADNQVAESNETNNTITASSYRTR